MLSLDKIAHALACYAVCTASFLLVLPFIRPWAALVLSLALGVSAGLLKEWYDSCHPGHVASRDDLAADGIGIAVAACLELLVAIAM